MKVTKIHRVLKFKQSDWIKKYINFNTEKRTKPNSFEKDFLKLLINSVYGKTMENLIRINVRLVNKEKEFLKIPADQFILLIKYLVEIMLLFMK